MKENGKTPNNKTPVILRNGDKNGESFEYRFKRRESPLTTLYNTPGGRVLYSLILTFVFVTFLIESARYICRPAIFWDDVAFLRRCFTPFHAIWYAIFVLHAPIIGILWPAARLSVKHASRMPLIFSVFATLMIMGVCPILIITNIQTSEIIRNVFVMEQVRLIMKVVAYSVEISRKEQKNDVAPPTPIITAELENNNLSDVQKKAEAFGGSKASNKRNSINEKTVKQQDESKSVDPLSLKVLVYFLFAPTLVFRPSYPTLGRPRSYKMIAKCVFDSLMLALVGLVCLRRYYMPAMGQVGTYPLSQMSAETIISIVTWSVLMGWICLMGIGFGFLHCWLNIWAEILDFGDRQFYKPWWECYGIDEFMRTWNFLIHSWISAYLFKPTLALTKSKQLSLLVVILVSAFIHDWIMSVIIGKATTVFAAVLIFVVIPTFVFSGPANYLQRERKLNFFTWLVLTMTSTVMGLMGGSEYWTRMHNCPDPTRSRFNLIPGIFDCEI